MSSEFDALIEKEFAESVSLSKHDTKVKNWLSIGNYALNWIMSKNLLKAIPVGRITGFDGLAGSGKSLLAICPAKDPKVDHVILFETEGGGSSQELFEYVGVPLEKITIIKVDTLDSYEIDKEGNIKGLSDSKLTDKGLKEGTHVPGLIYKVDKLLKTVKANNIKKNILIILDSLGNISSSMEKSGSIDMGNKSHLIGKFFRLFDTTIENTGVSFVFTNKLYTNIGDEYNPFKVSGGVNAEYNPSTIVRLESMAIENDALKKQVKELEKTAIGATFANIRATITKSRFGCLRKRLSFILDLEHGLDKYAGLFGLLEDYEIITKAGAYCSCEIFGETKFFAKDFIQLVKDKGEAECISYFQKRLDAISRQSIVDKTPTIASFDESVEIETKAEVSEEVDTETKVSKTKKKK
jgi:RecA/RadA recombinase